MFSNLFGLFKLEQIPLVGIDISSATVKLLELSRGNDSYRVEAYAVAPLPPQSVVEKNIKQVEQVATAIAKVVNEAKSKRKYAAVCVSGSSVITRIIQVNANFSENEIIEQIELEADRYIPYPLEEVYFDFEIVGQSQKHPDLLDVVLAAARIETVESRVEAVRQGGLKATIMDVESYAMERAFNLILNQLPEEVSTQNTALFDLGSSVTTLHVFKNSHSIYTRDQVFGVKQLADEIERRYGLSTPEAIAALKYGGLPEDYINEVLEPFKESMASQVSRALQIFFSSTDETAIQYLVLSGGGANLPGLEETLQNKIGIKTFVANPFANMQISPNVNQALLMEDAPSLMLGVGLALRNFQV